MKKKLNGTEIRRWKIGRGVDRGRQESDGKTQLEVAIIPIFQHFPIFPHFPRIFQHSNKTPIFQVTMVLQLEDEGTARALAETLEGKVKRKGSANAVFGKFELGVVESCRCLVVYCLLPFVL